MAEKRVCSKCHPNTPVKVHEIPVVWIIGPPGSGKTIQADKIVAAYGFQHISTGNLISRQYINPFHPSRASMLSVVSCGPMISTNVLLQGLVKEIKLKGATAKGFVVDGYPHSKYQASVFENGIGHVDAIFVLDAPTAVLTSRLMKRSDLSQQSYNAEAITEQLASFETAKEELIDTYKEKVIIINANKKPDEVFDQINKYLVSIMNNISRK